MTNGDPEGRIFPSYPRVMPNRDPQDGFFYPTLTQIMDSFSCSPLFYLFVYLF